MDSKELRNRFEYHQPPTDMVITAHQKIRHIMHEAADIVDMYVPEGREKSLAVTKLEEAMMWANAGIARVKDYEEVMDQ